MKQYAGLRRQPANMRFGRNALQITNATVSLPVIWKIKS